jgi:hypothetical protein
MCGCGWINMWEGSLSGWGGVENDGIQTPKLVFEQLLLLVAKLFQANFQEKINS